MIQQYVYDMSKEVLTGSNSTKKSITFPRSKRDFDPVKVNTKNIECVKKAKILDVTLSSDLKS